MTRLCTVSSWFCNCLAVALLVVGLMVVPEQALADGGKTCADVCAQFGVGSPQYNTCMYQCSALNTHPCGGRDTSPPTCAVAGSACYNSTDPNCSGQSGCNGWPGECPCSCQPTGLPNKMSACGCF